MGWNLPLPLFPVTVTPEHVAPNAALVGDESPSWGTIRLQALLEKNNNNNNLNKTTK